MTKKIIDLFCGAGGFSYGFEMENFETVLGIDKWGDAIETFNFNHKKAVGKNLDIHEFTNKKIEEFLKNNEIDGIIGGPPCQGFSMVGTRDRFDERNDLYLEYYRFVKKVRPKFFIIENVKGLLTLENGFFKKDIVERFGSLGYNINYKVLRASEYGVPQSRERVFFVGLSIDYFGNKYFEYPIPNKVDFVSTEEAISDLPSLDNKESQYEYSSEPKNDFQKLMRKNNKGIIHNNDGTNHTDKTISIINLVPDGGNIRDLPSEYYKVRNYNASFKRMDSQKPSTTIDCGHRNYFHYKENRVPTVRESARIQSFPDRFIFKGSKTSQYTQVGNAVPPLVAQALAKQINELLDEVK